MQWPQAALPTENEHVLGAMVIPDQSNSLGGPRGSDGRASPSSGNSPRWARMACNLSGDGTPEIVFATYSPNADKSDLFVLSNTGQLLHQVDLPDRGAMSVPTIASSGTPVRGHPQSCPPKLIGPDH